MGSVGLSCLGCNSTPRSIEVGKIQLRIGKSAVLLVMNEFLIAWNVNMCATVLL